MPGKKLHVKCYLEGIEVPLNSVQINIATNQASSATIMIPPTNTVFKIRPRTHVHLFWYDDATNNWYLLWEGEVLSVGFAKSTSSRNAVLHCADLTNYWDYTIKMLVELRKGISFNRNILMYYGDTEATIEQIGDSTLDKIWGELSEGANLPAAIYAFLKDITDKLPYYQRVNEKMNLNTQLTMVDDKRVTGLIKNDVIKYLTQNLLGNESDHASIRQMILGFCSLVSYSHVCAGAPSFVGGVMNSFFLKPNLFGCLPPRCNVIFPDLCSNLDYSRSFMDEPTRSMIQMQPVANLDDSGNRELICPFRTSPAYLAKAIVAKGEGNPTTEDLFKTFTDEELEKGIIPMTTQVPYPELFSLKPDGDSFNNNFLHQYGDYVFQMSRYAARTLSFTSELNPWIVCDFPCIVFDASRSFVATVSSISHSIGADGGGQTTVQCSLARELDVDNDDTPYIPAWMAEAYDPININGTYQKLLGCTALGDENSMRFESADDQGVFDTEDEPDSGQSSMPLPSMKDPDSSQLYKALRVNISKIAATVYNQDPKKSSEYSDAVDANAAYSFADSYRRRSLALMKDVLDFYNLSTEEALPPSQFNGELFNYLPPDGMTSANPGEIIVGPGHKRGIIQTYVNEINFSHVLDGR